MRAPTSTPIQTREQLLHALGVAAELEHLLLCQYLFAAYTLKRTKSEGLGEVDVEWVRRWGSSVALVARQEMEHLGLVMNMRSAIGGEPYFTRPNFPQKLDYFGPSELKQELTAFNRETVQRFQFFEQPHPPPGPDYCVQSPALQADRFEERLREVGIERRGGGYTLTDEMRAALRKQVQEQGLKGPGTASDLTFTSIQDLYLQIFEGFILTAEALGPSELFCGDPQRQVWGGPGSPYASTMNDLNQYGLDIIQVKDLTTASIAILEILFQGEGLLAPKSYIEHTHYCLFTSILQQMGSLESFTPARPVVDNPLTELHPDITAPDEVNLITRPETLEVAQLFNGCYQLMLEMLLLLYGFDMNDDQRGALTDAAFFPMMTMFVRPLSEVLTQLPAFADSPSGPVPGNAGPGFELSAPKVTLAATRGAAFDDVQAKLDQLVIAFRSLMILNMQTQYPAIVPRLRDMGDNMQRLATDWRAQWTNVGRSSNESGTNEEGRS